MCTPRNQHQKGSGIPPYMSEDEDRDGSICNCIGDFRLQRHRRGRDDLTCSCVVDFQLQRQQNSRRHPEVQHAHVDIPTAPPAPVRSMSRASSRHPEVQHAHVDIPTAPPAPVRSMSRASSRHPEVQQRHVDIPTAPPAPVRSMSSASSLTTNARYFDYDDIPTPPPAPAPRSLRTWRHVAGCPLATAEDTARPRRDPNEFEDYNDIPTPPPAPVPRFQRNVASRPLATAEDIALAGARPRFWGCPLNVDNYFCRFLPPYAPYMYFCGLCNNYVTEYLPPYAPYTYFGACPLHDDN